MWLFELKFPIVLLKIVCEVEIKKRQKFNIIKMKANNFIVHHYMPPPLPLPANGWFDRWLDGCIGGWMDG